MEKTVFFRAFEDEDAPEAETDDVSFFPAARVPESLRRSLFSGSGWAGLAIYLAYFSRKGVSLSEIPS